MATFYPTIRIRGDSPRFLIWECLIWGNHKSQQSMWHSKLWKNIKSSETFNISTVPLLEGLQALQKYKRVPEGGEPWWWWGGGQPLQIGATFNTPFNSPLFRCFEVADIGQKRLGHYWADRCMLAAHVDHPNGFAASGPKKKEAATKTCL